MNFLKNCLWVILLLILIDFLVRHLYGYRVVDVVAGILSIPGLFAH